MQVCIINSLNTAATELERKLGFRMKKLIIPLRILSFLQHIKNKLRRWQFRLKGDENAEDQGRGDNWQVILLSGDN